VSHCAQLHQLFWAVFNQETLGHTNCELSMTWTNEEKNGMDNLKTMDNWKNLQPVYRVH
jgi:hypothetical protein